jgi:large conductance mechanosensitive channel
MVKEFKEFIARGNMIDLAVGFIMGAAFTAVVNGLVQHLLMPTIAIPFGEPSFDGIIWTVNGSEVAVGSFITAAVTFLLIAVATFLFVVRPYNAVRARMAKPAEPVPAGPTEVELLIEIRDALTPRRA